MNTSKILKILILLAFLVVLGYFGGRYYAYNMGQRDVKSEKAAFILKATDIVKEFQTNAETANKKYLEKAVEFTGKVSAVDGTNVIIDEAVNCNFEKLPAEVKVGAQLKIKGRVMGFDDMFGELKVDQSSISK